jgi:hypothetical protein
MLPAYAQARDAEFERKLRLLMKHYSIEDPHGWRALALHLARDHVPGFELDLAVGFKEGLRSGPVVLLSREKTGRPNIWTGERLSELLEAVEKTKRLGQNSDLDALKSMSRRPWAPPKYWGPPANHRGDLSQWIRTLQSRLADAKSIQRPADKLVKLLQKISSEVP